MNKINNKSVNLSLKILTLMAFVLIFTPFHKAAAQTVCGDGGCDYTWQTPATAPAYNDSTTYSGGNNQYVAATNNPIPVIDSTNPSSSYQGSGAKTITIVGSGFVPNSVARVNDSNRSTIFIDDSHLLATLSSSDMNRTGGFFITVYNPAPGGGYSNAYYFTLNIPSAFGTTNNNGSSSGNTVNGTTYPDTSATNTTNAANDNSTTTNPASNLASNAIFGSSSFLPSGLIQWILFGIFILLIIILVRKIFGAREAYEETPMKYE